MSPASRKRIDTQAQSAGLTVDAAAIAIGKNVEMTKGISDTQWSHCVINKLLATKVCGCLATVDVTLPVPGIRRTRATASLRRPVPV